MSRELEIKVYGRVQGVLLRKTIQKYAIKLGIRGCVYNRSDGSVTIISQGTKKQLQNLLIWLQGSPGFSHIRAVNYEWRAPSENFKEFIIVREPSFVLDQARSFLNLGKSFLRSKNSIAVPKHIAVIPDGNRRWARKKGLAPQMGHYTAIGFQNLHLLLEEAQKQGVEYFTLWGFSTENWKRNPEEVNALMRLFVETIHSFREEARQRQIRFRHLGRKDRLPVLLVREIALLEKETKNYTKFNVQLCLDYGGADELLRAFKKIIRSRRSKISEETLLNSLDSSGLPPIDLVIRTSGEQRLSGFMPLQTTYAELYFSQVHFPDFNVSELRKAIEEFGRRQRRFGGDGKK